MDFAVIAVPAILIWGYLLALLAHDVRGSTARRLAFIVIYGVTGLFTVGILLALLRRFSFERLQREAGRAAT
jgi:hypothetical protein